MKCRRSFCSLRFLPLAFVVAWSGAHAQIAPFMEEFNESFLPIPAGEQDGNPAGTTLYGPDTNWENVGFSRMEQYAFGAREFALRINGFDDQAPQGALYTFDGALEADALYAVEAKVFNGTDSYVKFEVTLYNATDDEIVDRSGDIVIQGGDEDIYTVNLSYVAPPEDAGDTLQLRFLKPYESGSGAMNTARDIFVDSLALEVTYAPEDPVVEPYSTDFGANFTTVVPGPLDTNEENGYTGTYYGPELGWENIGYARMEKRASPDGDGGLAINGIGSEPPIGSLYTFDGVMKEGTTYTLRFRYYNANSSYVKFKGLLFNLTDDAAIATTDDLVANANTLDPVEESVSYTATAADEGDTLQMRFIRPYESGSGDMNTARDIYLEEVALQVETPVDPWESYFGDLLENRDDGEVSSEALGWYNVNAWPWIWSYRTGSYWWVYEGTDAVTMFWFDAMSNEWIYSSNLFFPWYYNFSTGQWAYLGA